MLYHNLLFCHQYLTMKLVTSPGLMTDGVAFALIAPVAPVPLYEVNPVPFQPVVNDLSAAPVFPTTEWPWILPAKSSLSPFSPLSVSLLLPDVILTE